MQKSILHAIEDAIRAISFLKATNSLQFIEEASRRISRCYQMEGKLLIAGNGGSLCDAMHFAEELTSQFREKRKALPAIALADPAHMSCAANDFGYADVFSRAVEAYGKPGDIFISLTTSGNSENLVRAVPLAQSMGLSTISFLGKTGGRLKGVSDLEWIVDGFTYSDRIQEAHMAAIHIIIEMVEKELFSYAATI